MQRIRIEDIKADEWFLKNYIPASEIENEDVNLDEVFSIFEYPEVFDFFSPSFHWGKSINGYAYWVMKNSVEGHICEKKKKLITNQSYIGLGISLFGTKL